MPLVSYLAPRPNTEIYLWRITEELDYFTSKLDLAKADRQHIISLIPKRQIEWILPRYLCSAIWGYPPSQYRKDSKNKPYLHKSTSSISISHSKDMFAIIMSEINCGIDIQIQTDRIANVQHKFTNQKELEHFKALPHPTSLHAIWCAKEAIYKCYGRKQISMLNDIQLLESSTTYDLPAHVKANGTYYSYLYNTIQVENYMLAYAFETI